MRLKTAVALTCAAVLVLAGCSRKGSSTRRLAFVTNNASDFWTIARKGTEKADAERADITVEFRLGDGTAAGQKRIVEDLLANGVETPLADGDRIHVGAWTTIRIEKQLE